MRNVIVALVLFSGSSHSALAQSANETVAFIAIGAQKGNETTTWSESGGKLSIADNYGTSLTISSVSNCVYKIAGIRHQSSLKGNVSYNIDFTEFSDFEISHYTLRPGEEYQNLKLNGVKTCSEATLPRKGDSYAWSFQGQDTIERFPAAGSCRRFLETDGWRSPTMIERTAKAINYFRQKYCSGRAF